MLGRSLLVAVLFPGVFLAGDLVRAEDGTPPSKSRDKIQTVFLRTVPDQGTNPKQLKRILAREIFHQSFLLTAREDFGLCTRDEALGETCVPASSVATFRVDVLFTDNKPSGIKLTRDLGSKSETVLEEKLAIEAKASLDYEQLVKVASSLAATRFAEVLTAAGCEKRDASAWEAATVPSDVALHLGQMRILSQFSVVRELHARHSKSRATTATQAALVRGYANLGLLTSFLCHPAHKVFKARALLYAERLRQESADNPTAWWLRGYALALTGLPAAALDSVAHGDQLLAKTKPAEKSNQVRPQWAATVERFCRFEVEQLDTGLADDDLKELTQVLRFVAIDASHFSTQTVEAAVELLPKLPECYLVHDALCQAGGVSILHEATETAPQVFATTLPQRLTEMAGLPGNVAQAADRQGPFGKLMKELDIAGGQPNPKDEMSWTVLGRLLREVMFMHVWRRLDFVAYSLCIDADEIIDQSALLVADHPYRLFFETRRWERDAREAAGEKLQQALDTSNLDFNCVGLFYPMQGANDYRAQLFPIAFRHGDVIEPDMVIRLTRFTGKSVSARGLLKVSPFSPYAIAKLIEEDWGYAGPHAAEWEKQHLQHPGVQAALGAKYLQLKQLDDAERCLNHAIQVVSDQELYENLADIYAERGDRIMWQATLDEFLTKPDYRLSHAHVRVKVAKYFMREEQWDKALPYALDAAETWAEWAMDAACRCYEEMQNYDESEKWLLRIVERYRNNEYKWYGWCLRTGHGDLAAARAAVEARIKRDGSRADTDTPLSIGMFYVAEHRLAKAYELYARQQRLTKDPLAGLFAALTADELKKPEERNAALQVIETEGSKYESDGRQRTALIALARMWNAALRTPEKKIDLPALEELRDDAGFDQANFSYFAGRILQSQGLAEEGKEYLLLAARTTKDTRARTLSRALLREQGVAADNWLEKPAAETK